MVVRRADAGREGAVVVATMVNVVVGTDRGEGGHELSNVTLARLPPGMPVDPDAVARRRSATRHPDGGVVQPLPRQPRRGGDVGADVLEALALRDPLADPLELALEVGHRAAAPRDDEGHLAAHPVGRPRDELGERAAAHLLVRLGQLAAHGRAPVGTEGVLHGHSYEVWAWFLQADARDLQRRLDDVLANLDHTHLDDELAWGEALAEQTDLLVEAIDVVVRDLLPEHDDATGTDPEEAR